MGHAAAGLIASIGLALVITSLTLPGRQTPAVIEKTATGVSQLEEASLGYQV